jgi:hypothetical protein
MHIELTTSDIAARLRDDKNAGWTYDGSMALAEHLEQLEQDLGESTELDIVAIRCEFTEYGSATEAVKDYSGFEPEEADDDETEDDCEERIEGEALEWLQDRTTVLEFDGGIIIQQF